MTSQPHPTTQSPAGGRRPGWVVVPPPPLFALALAGGMWLNRAVPLPAAPRAVAAIALGVGWLVVGVAGLLMASATLLFALRRTTIVPHRHASTLIVVGPYRFTRNPMYVGLAAICVGAALVANTSWPLLLVLAPLWLLHAKTIPFEEDAMERAFGDDYREYCRRVRRWL